MSAPVLARWSLTQFCGVCERSGLVRFLWLDGALCGRGVAACPHSTRDPQQAMPVLCVPWLKETPRKEAA